MAIQFWDGKPLIVDGKIALDPACCCEDCDCCEEGTIKEKMYVNIGFSGVGGSPCDPDCEDWWNANTEWEVTRLHPEDPAEDPCRWTSDPREHPCGGDVWVAYYLSCFLESSPGANDGTLVVYAQVIRGDWPIPAASGWEGQGEKWFYNMSGKIDCSADIGIIDLSTPGNCQLQDATFTVSSTAP